MCHEHGHRALGEGLSDEVLKEGRLNRGVHRDVAA